MYPARPTSASADLWLFAFSIHKLLPQTGSCLKNVSDTICAAPAVLLCPLKIFKSGCPARPTSTSVNLWLFAFCSHSARSSITSNWFHSGKRVWHTLRGCCSTAQYSYVQTYLCNFSKFPYLRPWMIITIGVKSAMVRINFQIDSKNAQLDFTYSYLPQW